MKFTNTFVLLFYVMALPIRIFSQEVLPSNLVEQDQDILNILAKLKDNDSAFLPPVKTKGDFNEETKKYGLHLKGPGTRDYCLKWVWAEDRKTALFCGANAGVPHRLNDVWEYDLAKNTWIMLWSPDPDLSHLKGTKEENQNKLQQVAMVKEGMLMTKRGAPFDPVHTWWALTYDPIKKKLLWVMGNYNKAGYSFESDLPLKNILLWEFDPNHRSWNFNYPKKSFPPGHNASILEYIPDLKGNLWYTNTWRSMDTSVLDSETWGWTNILKKEEIYNNPDCPESEAIGAYDSVHKKYIVHHGGNVHKGQTRPKKTYEFDVVGKKWKKILEGSEGPIGFDNTSSMVFDSFSELCFVLEKDALWSYSVKTNVWEKILPNGPNLNFKKAVMACYNPEYNVIMAFNSEGKVWVYRAQLKKKDVSSEN